jgi:hypothetical protein
MVLVKVAPALRGKHPPKGGFLNPEARKAKS